MSRVKLIIIPVLCLALAVAASAQQVKWNELDQLGAKLFKEGKFSEAAQIAQKAVEAALKTFGPENNNLAKSLNNWALYLQEQGKYAEAEAPFKRSLAIREKVLGKDHVYVGLVLNNLGLLYVAQSRYSEAEPLYKRALLIYEKARDPEVGWCLSNLGELYRKEARYSEAEPLYKKALQVYEKARGKEHTDVALVLNNLGLVYDDQARYSEAEPLYKRCLAIREKKLGKEHPYTAITVNNLAFLYKNQGKYSEAEALFKRSLVIREKSLGKDHPDVALALNSLALLYHDQSKYSEIEPLYKRALTIYEKANGADHPDVAWCLSLLADNYSDAGKYFEAEPLYKRSLEVREKKLGRDHPFVAGSLTGLAAIYRSQGKYSEAEPLYKRSLEIRERKFGSEHPDVATSLNNLALLYKSQGKYSEAEPLYKRSLAIREKTMGKDHPYMVSPLGNLGLLYQERGNQAEALRMFQQALDNCKRNGLPTGWPQNNIANIYLDQGDIARAESIIAEAGYNSTRARLCLMKKDYHKAKDYYERMRRWAEENRNADNLFIAYTGLGMACEGLQDDVHAAEYYRKAVDFTEELRSSLQRNDREKFFDVKVYGVFRTAPYEGLVRVLLRMNKFPEALKESEYSKARVFAEHASGQTQGGRVNVPMDILQQDNSFQNQLATLKQARENAYKQTTSAAAELPQGSARVGAEQNAALAELLKKKPEPASALEKAGFAVQLTNPQKARIQALDNQIGLVEKQFQEHVKMLWNKYPLFAATKYPQPMSLDQTFLKENEWALEYDVTDTGVAIFLVKGKQLKKALFKSIERKELDALVEFFRKPLEINEISATNLARFDFASGQKLAEILLADVLTDLPQGTPVILVPDDSLGVLPFEMLVLNAGGKVKTDKELPYVIEAEFFGDRNPISYYQSITALTLARTLAKRDRLGNRTLAMVDPVFSGDDERLIKAATAKRRAVLDKITGERLMSMNTERGVRFRRLALTSHLGESLKKADPDGTDLYEGLNAQKNLLIRNDLIPYKYCVFATHGYFGNDLPTIQEPVLILTLSDQSEGQDGFLRMSEVMGLKLNADMVALTACQSGIGGSVSGEGTMGMGRAFQYAGAKSVLMSLWSVAESSSVDLVTNFFKHLREGKNKLEALKLARDEIRQAGYDHPFFWAPFILVGEVD